MQKLKNILIITGGILFILFTILHLSFWQMFNWEVELSLLSTVNSNIMQMINIAICVLFLSIAYIMLFQRNEVLNTKIGKTLLIASSIFFFVRVILEFAFPEGSVVFGIVIFICGLVFLIPAIIK